MLQIFLLASILETVRYKGKGHTFYAYGRDSWWRHQMETFSALLVLCAGNSPVPVNSPHKGQWRGALMFSLICAWINDWANNREAGDLRRHRGHYNVIVMFCMESGLLIILLAPKGGTFIHSYFYFYSNQWIQPTTNVRQRHWLSCFGWCP